MNNTRKIGIMGGTFNPVHIGHLIMAESAYEQFDLDEVIFMLSCNPPHKQNLEVISDEHRSNMVQLAIDDNPHFTLSLLELERAGFSYTADTLRQLTAADPAAEYYFIVGGDSFFQIENWKEPETIFSLAHILAASRHQISLEDMQAQLHYLTGKYRGSIDILSIPNMDISSCDIRCRIEAGRSVRYYVPHKVEQYILDKNLYGLKK